MALARQGSESLQVKAVNALLTVDYEKLDQQGKLDLLRAYSLVFVRLGAPGVEAASDVLAQLDDKFPAKDMFLNRELVTVLVYLNSPTVAGKTLKLMAADEVTDGKITDLLTRNRGYGHYCQDAKQSSGNSKDPLRVCITQFALTVGHWNSGKNTCSGLLEPTNALVELAIRDS